MNENSLLLMMTGELCTKAVHTCAPGDSAAAVAGMMSANKVSSLIVRQDDKPVGIITDRDFRNKLIPFGLDSRTVEVGSIMSSPVITVSDEDYLFEAIYKMSKHNLHRVVVVDGAGTIKGIITDSDIFRLQSYTLQYLLRDLEASNNPDELKAINSRVTDLVINLFQTGIKTKDIVHLIAHINDALVKRLIHFLRAEPKFADLPKAFSFVVLGSEGRMEQTLKTDQDNALIYGDELTPDEIARVKEFAVALVDSMIYVGFPPCPGGTMAKNERWQDSLAGWKEQIDDWISRPTQDNILNYSMFSDVRTVYGDKSYEEALKNHVLKRGKENSIFLAHMAKNVTRFSSQLGFFGQIKVPTTGENKGKLDIKKSAIFPITEGIRVLALEAGILKGGTLEKIEQLRKVNALTKEDALELTATYSFAAHLRLRGQISEIKAGQKQTNFISLPELNNIELGRLKIGLKVIKDFHSLLTLRFKLNFISD